MSRYAIIRSGKVENVTAWDGDVLKWQAPPGTVAVIAPPHVGPGWTYAPPDNWSPPSAAVPVEINAFDAVTPRDFVEALAAELQAQGALSAARATALVAGMRNRLKR